MHDLSSITGTIESIKDYPINGDLLFDFHVLLALTISCETYSSFFCPLQPSPHARPGSTGPYFSGLAIDDGRYLAVGVGS